jgi:acylphosphatase
MENAGDKVRVHLVIEGRVQGVFFRATALKQASRLGITGWVRNRADGSVEIVAEGEQKKIEKLIDWCRQGPPGADVHHIHVEPEAFQNEFQSFRISR